MDENSTLKTLDRLSVRKKAPIAGYIIFLVVYLITNQIVINVADSVQTVKIAGGYLPATAFVGTLYALSNICVILMTIFYERLGFYTAITALLINLPMLIVGILVGHNLRSLPGLFTNILTIITISSIYLYNRRITEYQTRLRKQAVTDMLTGLPNRYACTETVKKLIRRGERFSLIYVDINDFKSINTIMGFDVGNMVLVDIASRWKKIADSGETGTLDLVARLGGDEFILLVCNYNSLDDVKKTISCYENVLKNRLVIQGYEIYVTASFGYVEYPTDAKDVDTLFSYANATVGELKRINSSEHSMHFKTDCIKADGSHELEGIIRNALEKDAIFFYLQPQYDMSHKLRGFEVLARMKDEKGNMISPGDFIPAAEKLGLIDQVDGAVFKKAAVFFGDLVRRTGTDITLSINVSVRHLMKSDFSDEIREILELGNFPPDQLEIEITESILIDSADKALSCIDDIRKMGIKLAIDDFGTGYSSLSYLNSLPANLLKIDKSFIDKMNENESSRQYVAAIISIGHIMGLEVISEGVESDEQLDTLGSIGCDYIQGYIWGQPMPPEKVVRDLKL